MTSSFPTQTHVYTCARFFHKFGLSPPTVKSPFAEWRLRPTQHKRTCVCVYLLFRHLGLPPPTVGCCFVCFLVEDEVRYLLGVIYRRRVIAFSLQKCWHSFNSRFTGRLGAKVSLKERGHASTGKSGDSNVSFIFDKCHQRMARTFAETNRCQRTR